MFGIEVCDDGLDDGEGCVTGCSGVNPLYLCTLGTTTTSSICTPKCGDGKVVDSRDICDDGNNIDSRNC